MKMHVAVFKPTWTGFINGNKNYLFKADFYEKFFFRTSNDLKDKSDKDRANDIQLRKIILK